MDQSLKPSTLAQKFASSRKTDDLSNRDILLGSAALMKHAPVSLAESRFTEFDIHLFKEGNHFSINEKLGSHPTTIQGQHGTYFAVWAPNAAEVSVIGNFNDWNPHTHHLGQRPDGSGIWEGFISKVGKGSLYKYRIRSLLYDQVLEKTDPYALMTEVPPKSASVVWDLEYQWDDSEWMKTRSLANGSNRPISIYEVHLPSWRRIPEEGNRSLSYRELAPSLADYIEKTGFTHVEFLPVMEHPFFGSWGYQLTGYFAPTSRYGTPQDLMYLVDYLHQRGIGVIMDWVPSHFASDAFGLAHFDGSHLFEHADMRKGFHPDWGSYIFNYGRNEVRNFLISNALYWLKHYHIDGLRVDAVASMLYLDYSRKEGEWIPNHHGGRENLEAIYFLKRCNEEVYQAFPDVQMIAEESTAWPNVSKPTYIGGLGFGFKWNMGWMNDTIQYMTKDPIYRKYHHHNLTFAMWYAFSEHFVLSLSHDEVVHGKGSLLSKMPGMDWDKFSNLRLLMGYLFMQPGKKLLFMGGEFGQGREWNHDTSLDWHLLDIPQHQGQLKWVSDLNRFYRSERALYEGESNPACFHWVDFGDWESSIISFVRKSEDAKEQVLVVFNFTPVARDFYRVGVPCAGFWGERLNSDATIYGGSGCGNWGGRYSEDYGWQGQPYSLMLSLPPLSVSIFKWGES